MVMGVDLISMIFVCILILSVTIHVHAQNVFEEEEEKVKDYHASSLSSSSSSSPSKSLMKFPLRQSHGVATTAQVMRRLAAEKVAAGGGVGGGSRNNQSEVLPLFQGMGVHYVYVWIGTPPQRVTVIVDTGSHHTAFPCVGCKCGKHMDPHWDPSKSSSSAISKCLKGAKCFFSQSYSEGSSWHAYKVQDKLWMGGPNVTNIPTANNYALDFEFGCQDSETGLFRTQNIDGIMGFSAQTNTLPFQLYEQKITNTKMFSMCFRVGGGFMTIGGMDTTVHDRVSLTSSESVEIKYAKLQKPSGWFTVKVLDVLMIDPEGAAAVGEGSLSTSTGIAKAKSIGGATYKFNSGKGAIVDSGTTDTYLPSGIASNFRDAYKKIAGIAHSNSAVTLPPDKLDKLPTIVYRLEGMKAGNYIDVLVPPSSYMEPLRGGTNKFTNRIYLTEASGSVLGANFMNGHDVIFDIDQGRIGFATSKCLAHPTPSTHHHVHHSPSSNLKHKRNVSTKPPQQLSVVEEGKALFEKQRSRDQIIADTGINIKSQLASNFVTKAAKLADGLTTVTEKIAPKHLDPRVKNVGGEGADIEHVF